MALAVITARGRSVENCRLQIGLCCFFQAADVYVVSGYYAPRYHPLPPGLKKKFYRTGHLQDGWEKKMETLPPDVERQLVPIPRDYRRGLLDGYFILYYPRTGAVLDSVALFPPK